MSNWSNAGRVRPVSKGTWSSTVTYTVLDLVTSSDKLRSYIATQNVPAGTPLTNTAYWQVLVDATAINDTANSLMDRLASPFDKSGSVVTCHPVEGYSLKVKTLVKPAQSGSGDPSPSNIRPISGHTGAKLTRCGKNVLSSKLLGGNESYVSVTTDGRWRINNTSGNTIYIGNEWTNLPAGDYCFRTDSAIANMLLYIQKNQDDYSEYISDGIPMRIIHVSNGEKIRILCAVPNGTNATISVWATIGVNPKPFISYQGKTFSASFGQTVYGGTLDWNTGVLTVDRAVYNFTGNEPFSLASGGIPYFSVTKSAGVIASVVRFDQTSAENGSCSHYKPVSAWSGNACEYMGVTHSFRFTDTRFAAVDDFKAYLAAQKTAGTPVQVCCKLATPTIIQLTPAQVLALKGTNSLYSDCGDTAVFGRIDPEWMNEQFRNAIIALGGNV